MTSAPNSPGGVARSRHDTGANLLQELEALSQALYKASQGQNIGPVVGAPPPVPSPRKEAAGSHIQRRESMPARPMNDVFSKNLSSPGGYPNNNQAPVRKNPQARHSISAKPSAPLYEDHESDDLWKQTRQGRHSIAAPRAFEADEAPVPRVEVTGRKLQPWHSQGFEQNLPEVTNFPAWLEDNINFSKKLEAAPEKKKSIWNWKPFRTLSHIGHTRHNCLFTVHVHAIEGLPPAMNGLRLTVHWRHKDRTAQTMPSRVFQGSAEFEETLQLRCSVYGHKSAHHAVKYMPKAFTLCVVALDVDELILGEHRLDLSRLLPEAPDSEHEDEDKPLSWTTSFKLSGKAKGGTLVVTFGYEILHKEKGEKSGRFGSVIGSPSPSMPSPSLRSFNSLPHSAHGTPRPRPSDVNQYLSPTMSEPGDYHDYMGMEHLNLDESSPQEPPRPSVSNPADHRHKLYGRPEFNSKPPKGLYPSESKLKPVSSAPPAAEVFTLAPSTPKQRLEPAEPTKAPSADISARSASYGSSDEDEQEFEVVDQGVEVGHLPESIVHPDSIVHSSIPQSRFAKEAVDLPDTTRERSTSPEHVADHKVITRELVDVSTPPEKIIHERKSESVPSNSISSGIGRRNSEVVVTLPVHVPTVVEIFENVNMQQAQLDLARTQSPLHPATSQSFVKSDQPVCDDEPQEEERQEFENCRVAAHFEPTAAEVESFHGLMREGPGRVTDTESKHPDDEVTLVSEVSAEVQEQDRQEEKVAPEDMGRQDVEEFPATVGSSLEEETEEHSGGERQGEEESFGELERWETAHADFSAFATHEEIRESGHEKQQEDEMWRNMSASASDQSFNPSPGYFKRIDPPPGPPPIDDLDDEVDLIAGEFLHMLEGEDRGGGGGIMGLSSDSENDSPRALLLKQFEQEALLEGGIGLRMGVPEIPELSLDGLEDSRQYDSGLHSDEYTHGGWQSEEDLELASIMEAAESELQKATQTMRSKTRAKMLEDAETEALMQEWGLNERAFQSSPPKPAQGFLDPMNNQLANRVPSEPPALAQGVGPVLQTKDGGMLRSLNPMLFSQGGSGSGRLMMQVSKPVVVPSEMGSSGLDIFRRMAMGGLDSMALQAMVAMPLEDITGKSMHQIAYESKASLEGPSHGQDYLPSNGHGMQMTSYDGFDSGRRRPRSGGLTAAGRRGLGGFSDSSDEFVSLEELAPMAMQKIEALAMDGLKIQADMTDETAPYSVDPLPYDMGGSDSSGRFRKGGLGSLEGVAAMHLLGARDVGEDLSTTGTDGLMSKVISIDEWMRLDAGMYDENDTKDEALAILAAHGAVHKDLVTRGTRDDRIRYLQGAKASANFGKGGFMGNMLTIAVLVQLRDPLRNNEPVGAPMMALVQAERVIVPPRPKIPRRAPSLLGNSERRWDDEEVEPEIRQQPQFKITAVHMSGLKPSEETQTKAQETKQKKAWGTQKQQQSGSRWLLANGMGKGAAGSKHPALKSKPQGAKTTAVKPGESLWSISARVHGTGSKWKEVAALNPHIRNPDVIFANQKIRTR